MTLTKDQAKQKLTELIEKHQRHKNEGRLSKINEENTKDYIDELFRILGWDFTEDIIKEYGTGKRKRVDYAFQISGTTKFLLEAKGYNESLTDENHIRQVLEYGYQNNKTWVVLSNFREIVVYNAKYYDKEEHIRRLFEPIRIEDAVVRLDDLWVLSKEGMKENLINQLANKYGKVKPKEAIDSLIFEDLMRWRKSLENAIRDHERLNRLPTDQEAAERYIDEAVQKILDRIIFVRVCEDRGLEEEELLRSCIKMWKGDKKYSLMDYVNRLFSKKNGEYNSGLFAAHYSENLTIENGVLEKIIEESYVNPTGLTYNFSAIDADILGTIYENYLAYIQKRVRDKETKQKSKRKAHGIYYTPTYIVDYIVTNTLGEKLKGCKKPEDVLKIKILDPACGSGSFLIRAYDEFKHWFANYQRGNGGEQTKLVVVNEKGLQTFMDQVLENCIYGVDLDAKAVEIAQLNLLLKSAEGKHKLPTLNHTIQCGNSLIDDPAVAGERAFKWEDKFPEVFRDGGFDVVIGNPPYVQLSMEDGVQLSMKEYLINRFRSSMGRLNTYGFFIRLGIDIAKEKGNVGFIIPNTILTQDYYKELREMILASCKIWGIANFSNLPFKDAVVENITLILEKTNSDKNKTSNQITIFDATSELLFVKQKEIEQNLFVQNEGSQFIVNLDETANTLKTKIINNTKKLGDFLDINQAIALKADRAKYLNKEKKDDSYKAVIDGRNIGRYSLNWDHIYLKYDLSVIHSCKREDIFTTSEKIFFRRVGSSLIGTLDIDKFYALNTLIVMNKKVGTVGDIRYFLGVFNSKLMNWYYTTFLKSTKKVFSEIQARQISNLPIKYGSEKMQHIVVELVAKIISLNKHLSKLSDKNSNEAQRLKAEIDQTDQEIDRLVYELYGLTEDEIKIVEEALK